MFLTFSSFFSLGLYVTIHAASAPGTIRGDLSIDVGRNIIHGSDSVENAQKEIALWFPEGLAEYTPALKNWIYE
jgi:nucleoside-diphosphate kinase